MHTASSGSVARRSPVEFSGQDLAHEWHAGGAADDQNSIDLLGSQRDTGQQLPTRRNGAVLEVWRPYPPGRFAQLVLNCQVQDVGGNDRRR